MDEVSEAFMQSPGVSGVRRSGRDQPFESVACARFGRNHIEQARVVVVREHDADQIEYELPDVEIRLQMPFADRELDGTAQLALQPREMLDDRIAHRPG